jgi:hypothetical protein
MKTLIKTLAHGLSLEGETRPLAPTVYTTAIRSEGALVESLAGIAQIAQGLGFTRYRETIYSSDGLRETLENQRHSRDNGPVIAGQD